jgi:hypothetical protein
MTSFNIFAFEESDFSEGGEESQIHCEKLPEQFATENVERF